MKRYKLVALGVLCVLLSGTSWVWAAQNPKISRKVISNGGIHVEQGTVSLDNTLGQPIVGNYNMGAETLCAGFWCQHIVEHQLYVPLVLKPA